MSQIDVYKLVEQRLRGILNMPDEPLDNKTKTPESQLMRVSIRGWIAIIVIITICLMSIWKIEIKEPLYTIAGMIAALYFGQNKQQTK